jgi:hypothetical protein
MVRYIEYVRAGQDCPQRIMSGPCTLGYHTCPELLSSVGEQWLFSQELVNFLQLIIGQDRHRACDASISKETHQLLTALW